LQRVAWRLYRVQAFLDDNLTRIMLEEDEDSRLNMAKRGLSAVVVVAKSIPLPYYGLLVRTTANATELLIRHGGVTWQGLLLSPQFSEALATIRFLAGREVKVSMGDFVIGLYYLLARRRFERGASPATGHAENAHCERVPDTVLRGALLRYAQLGARFPYISDEAELQRQLRLQGQTLILAHTQAQIERPAYYLSACKETKTVLLAIRGTHELQDVLTDLAAEVCSL
jgi:hypothetical protein